MQQRASSPLRRTQPARARTRARTHACVLPRTHRHAQHHSLEWRMAHFAVSTCGMSRMSAPPLPPCRCRRPSHLPKPTRPIGPTGADQSTASSGLTDADCARLCGRRTGRRCVGACPRRYATAGMRRWRRRSRRARSPACPSTAGLLSPLSTLEYLGGPLEYPRVPLKYPRATARLVAPLLSSGA